ncbi:putative N6-adenine methyltransferase-domain-containing protein [Polychytrium aggregatum]|uniref:putative N6-adenine methyltransferase-domain-containing protein n=1 Tax=Polychytrium aggregatum TaxID=110093 RepID=UPI0022FF1608|nr:putative N6-adenine methyltransferase-domain-containing protein [Polychytrium aggregatum]KAI9203604.1 putative N6-adenine methyltransferase-domain-containing protein [Polychytrium aggregatum]
MSNFDDDEPLTLSSDAMSALTQFLSEKKEQEAAFECLREAAHQSADQMAAQARILDMSAFKEDWQLSQFWYSEETAAALAKEAIEQTDDGAWIACVSSPTAFVALKNIDVGHRKIFVLEYDQRFAVFQSEFVFFDYNNPTDLDEKAGTRPLKGRFDFIIADPPFLSDECWSKTSETCRWLAKPEGCKYLVCTGAVMQAQIRRELDCQITDFEPKHKGGLSNEFRSFINYESTQFKQL